MEQITIAGEVFHAPIRYQEGHELTATEAVALNQVYHDNLRNNFAPRVKFAKANGSFNPSLLDALQAQFLEYANQYQFGSRKGLDPVFVEAMKIAKDHIRSELKKRGIKPSAVDPTAITDKAKQLIFRDSRMMDAARERLAQAKEAARSDLDDLLSDLNVA